MAGKRRNLCSRGCGRHEFVAFNLRGDSQTSVRSGLDAHNLAEAANIYVAGLRHLLGQRDNEFDFAANREISFSKKVETAVADVPGLRCELGPMRFVRKHAQR